MKSIIRIIGLMLLIFLNSCSFKDLSPYKESEKKLSTSKKLQKFHSVVHYPKDIRLNFPGYIVGIEKSPRNKIIKSQIKVYKNNRHPGITKDIKRLETEPKLMAITHIFAYDTNVNNKLGGIDTRPIYNLYKENNKNIPLAFEKSWDALKLLKDDIKEKIKKNNYNSIIVFSMGWNTSQEEAIRNFNSIYRNIKHYANNEFNPIFIGVTWPSEWEHTILPDFLVKLFSFSDKANDADEIGLSWMGTLLHNTLKDIKKPLIVIGHSFGARATSMATFEGNTIYNNNLYNKRNIDCLISLQGAYSFNRFLNKSVEGIYYNKDNTAIVLTSSVYDTAMDIVKLAPYVGNETTYNKFCNQNKYQKDLNCIKYEDNIKVTEQISLKLKKGKILYLNCDSIIKNNAYNSGGGAHSDIYDDEMGKLLWKIIKNIQSK